MFRCELLPNGPGPAVWGVGFGNSLCVDPDREVFGRQGCLQLRRLGVEEDSIIEIPRRCEGFHAQDVQGVILTQLSDEGTKFAQADKPDGIGQLHDRSGSPCPETGGEAGERTGEHARRSLAPRCHAASANPAIFVRRFRAARLQRVHPPGGGPPGGMVSGQDGGPGGGSPGKGGGLLIGKEGVRRVRRNAVAPLPR